MIQPWQIQRLRYLITHCPGFLPTRDQWEEVCKLVLLTLDILSRFPRAWKLMSKPKNFLVVAEDEPYFLAVYGMIRARELEIGRWTEMDERCLQAAATRINCHIPPGRW